MNETANSEPTLSESEKPAQSDDLQFPPFPEATDADFDEDISEEERNHYKSKFPDLHKIKSVRLHCTACDRHLGCASRYESRMRSHPMMRTLVCNTCHTFYNSGEFEKGDDGSELYCRWCGQGGQVYCCSTCPHVFCAKCVKRNFGPSMIKEIESNDDWKCFKCNPKNVLLWDHRAVCWALLRYCDLKNRITYQTQDPDLKEKYQKDCAQDTSECCRKKREKKTDKKKEEKKENDTLIKKGLAILPKLGPTIQVRKFASINMDDQGKEKRGQKRPASPKNKSTFIKNPISIAPAQKIMTSATYPFPKKIRMPSPAPMMNTVRFNNDPRKVTTYSRIRPRLPTMPIVPANQFNGFNNFNSYNSNMAVNDNINLSLENLTQGIDMVAVTMATNSQDDVVCTPDFPLEPLCEVSEDNAADDDVECITPSPVVPSKVNTPPPPPLITRTSTLSDLSAENIVQMTENDVSVNSVTGGLKFRVDPQTLSSNKMYRLPDGRIFAINTNSSMPGGYSATIVAITEAGSCKVAPKSAVYAAKLSAVTTQTPTPPRQPNNNTSKWRAKRNTSNKSYSNKVTKSNTKSRQCDLNVPVEWYRYNLIDAIDALDYSLFRLNALKKETTTVFLRTRFVDEMRNLHRTLDTVLNTSLTRFNEIRDNLNKGFKEYIQKKNIEVASDDDVEILPDVEEDPIFIDENSLDSNVNCTESQEVDLTGFNSSEYNDSGDKSQDKEASVANAIVAKDDTILDDIGPAELTDQNDTINDVSNDDDVIIQKVSANNDSEQEKGKESDNEEKKEVEQDKDKEICNEITKETDTSGEDLINLKLEKGDECVEENAMDVSEVNGEVEETSDKCDVVIQKNVDNINECKDTSTDKDKDAIDSDGSNNIDLVKESVDNETDIQQEMSDELIETLLKGDDEENETNTDQEQTPMVITDEV